MTTTDTIILCVAIAIIITPVAFCIGYWRGASRQPISRCMACGKPCDGLKCDNCAELFDR